jgi:membrane protein YdbS with pleckstrin-like domain
VKKQAPARLTEHGLEPIPGLPEVLPEGEVLLWQGAPASTEIAQRVFLVRWVIGYFLLLAGWDILNAALQGGPMVPAIGAAAVLLLVGSAGIGILAVWLGGSIVLEMGGGALAAYAWMEENATMVPTFLVPMAMYGVPILILGGAFALACLHYLDLRRRTYRVFNDVVVYEEGFLSRTNAFIPYENIADADLLKTLVDQILGLSDVKISCQGSSQDVKFRRLRRGDELKQAVAQAAASTGVTARVVVLEGNTGVWFRAAADGAAAGGAG